LIVEVETGNVLAYVGNSTLNDAAVHGENVDIIHSDAQHREYPEAVSLMPECSNLVISCLTPSSQMYLHDSTGFSPKNFDQSYNGAVTAGAALSQSLNIPAVKMLQKYSSEKFLDLLHKTGFTTFNKSADYYGLSLILGGGETSLWDLTGVYASLSRVLNRYLHEKKYYKEDYHSPVLIQQKDLIPEKSGEPDPILSASSIWLTYEALQKVNRPRVKPAGSIFPLLLILHGKQEPVSVSGWLGSWNNTPVCCRGMDR